MTKDRAIQLIKDVFYNLEEDDLPDEPVIVNSDTFLVGNNSPLDSIGFVSFITDLEERLIEETNNDDIHLVLHEIDGFNPEDAVLSVEILARHIVKVFEERNVINSVL